MAELRWSERALRSLLHIESWLGEQSPEGARNVIAEIDRTCTLIATMPSLGPPLPGTGLRFHITRRFKYRIVYRVTPDAIEIRDVVHPKREP
ncbi:MAG: type II toxin-antitoxin system RelE/ParE family toxin [Pseudomonadota bacterium]